MNHPCRSTTQRALAVALLVLGVSGCAHLTPPTSRPPADEVGIGYGTQPSDEVTGAVSGISADALGDQPVRQIEELLEGRLAGVRVIRTPGGGFELRIRGTTSIYGSNEPLYVVDGMMVYVRPGEGLYWLNPADIERIEVLKDASTTALYGMRGANGVVLITTRRGR